MNEIVIKDLKWDNTQLLEETRQYVTSYSRLVYTDESEAKKDRAEIRKRREAIETIRKEIKSEYEKPLKEFESRVKEVTVLLDCAEKAIKDQLDEMEAKRKAEKMEEIKKVYADMDFPFPVPLESVFRNEWLNKSFSMKEVKADLADKVFDIKQNVSAINKMADSAEIIEYYKETLNMADAMNMYDRAVNARAAALKAAQEAEKAAESLVEASFKVRGTIPQLKALKAFLAANNIEIIEE